ncbi:MAG TPA: tetratricopeptide repeat protein [Stellaceae bacterium]|jgi:tetratricopeptide (TPR) repeat protein|nr:tetratricopeptide repeat protein [Stellaceae bacterium]
MSRNDRRLARKSGGGAQDSFNEALRLHQNGQFAEAERLYRQILTRDPRHADSLHLLGVLAYQRGEPQIAIDLIARAIAINDAVPFFHNNRGLALVALGQIGEAAAHYERALALKADYVEALSNLGSVRLMQGRVDDAIGLHKRALAHNPDYAEGQMNLGNALREQGKPGEAMARYERAIALRPDYVEAMNNLGNALHDLGKLGEARAIYERALALRADFAEAHCNLGNVLNEMGELDAAMAQFERAIALRRDYAEAQNGLGLVLDKKGDYDEAIARFEQALARQPDDIASLNNLGAALQNRGRFDEAIARYERALALRVDYAEARKNLGAALHARAAERSGALLRERMKQATHDGVRGQYETLPFPARDPEGERYVLYVTPPDILAKVNQYCFGGARDFGKGMRVLVAGCGTGDSIMWLGEQLRETPSEIVALDLSSASIEIASARAATRGLSKVRFINASLLEAPHLGLGVFDYITCLGVLHHLPDPDAGLRALETVLAPDGGMGLMVYGLPGRAHIYAMQDLLRGLTAGTDDRAQKLAIARDVLSNLPPTNPFRLREGWENIQAGYLKDDTNLWDTLLHEQDRAYTASGVRELLAGAGLHLQGYSTYKAAPATCALQYDLDLFISDPAKRAGLADLPQAQREDMAEALDGSLALHTFYATRAPNAALNPAAPEAILSAMSEFGSRALAQATAPGASIPIVLRSGRSITYTPSPQAQRFLAAIDGKRSNQEIAQTLGLSLADIAPELRIPTALHWLVARRAAGTAFAPIVMSGKFVLPLRPEEPVLLVEPAR